MDTGIDCSWTGEMFVCTIHGTVHYSWIVKMLCSTMTGYSKMKEHFPWIVKNEFALSMDS